MPNQAQKTAIAKLLSDLIKSDSIIDQSEIRLYNQLQQEFGISQEQRIEAQNITMAKAMDQLRLLEEDSKQRLQEALLRTANADNQCVAKEALILLTLKYILLDNDNKYEVISCHTHGSRIDDKFIVYIDSDEINPDIHDEIECEYEAIHDKLTLWNFDFIYIPRITQKLLDLPKDYVQDIIRYMNPRFSLEQVEKLYGQLTTITTQGFTTQLLGAKMQMPTLITTQPALLINYATSIVGDNNLHTEFLKIRLDDTILHEVKQLTQDYADIITAKENVQPATTEDNFRYFGFYKALFDFLAQSKEGEQIAKGILIDIRTSNLTLEGKKIHLSPSQMTTYALILQQTITRGGLPHLRKNAHKNIPAKRFERMNENISQAYCRMYPHFSKTMPGTCLWNFYDNISNIASNIAHIRKKIEEAGLLNPELYIPISNEIPGDMPYYIIGTPLDLVSVNTITNNTTTKFTEWFKLLK